MPKKKKLSEEEHDAIMKNLKVAALLQVGTYVSVMEEATEVAKRLGHEAQLKRSTPVADR